MPTTKAKLQMLLEASSDGVWEIDTRGVTISVNQRLCELFGRQPDEFIGRSFLDFVDEAWRPLAIRNLADRVEGAADRQEFRFVRKDQTPLWLQLTVRPLVLDGDVQSVLALCSDVTASKEQQELLRSVQDLAQIGGWELEVSTGRTVWTEQVYRIYGVPLGTPTDKAQGIAHYGPQDRSRMAVCIERCTAGEPFHGTFQFFDAQDLEKWVEVRGEPVCDTTGRVYKLRGTIQDITKRRGVEHEAAALRTTLQVQLEELSVLKTRLDLALEGASLGIWDWDLRTNAVEFDRRWCEMLGLDPEQTPMELITWEKRVHPDDLAACYADIKAYTDGKTSAYENIHRMRHANGEWIYILDRGRYSGWDEQGHPVRFTGTHFDITAAVRARLQAEEAKARLEQAEVSGRFGSWELDLRTMVSTWSAGHDALFEVDDTVAASYETFLSRVMPEDRGIPQTALEEALSGRKTNLELQYRLALPSGTMKHIRAHARVQIGDDGRPAKIAGTVLDVTELVESRAAVEQALRAKSSFLANISHEIRTPMNGILGTLAILLDSHPDPALQERLRIMYDCGNSLLVLLNDVLDYSKLEAGKIELESEPLSLLETVKEVVDLSAPRAAEKGLGLTYRACSATLPWIRGDVTRLRQVLMNLTSNAIKFTSVGHVEVCWQGAEIEEGVWRIQFSVKDTGIGIDESARPHLFQPFSQADGSTTRRFGGTGLGLAISKELCARMKGEIWHESEVGRGSTFFFTITAPASSPPEPSTGPRQTLALDEKLGEKHPLRILMAEDNRTNQIVAISILHRLGYSAEVVSDGNQAIAAERLQPYDLILMDCQMPNLDGFEACRQIRARHTQRPGPRIVAFTASMFQEDIDRCHAAGMDAVIGKPVTIAAIMDVLASTQRRP